MPYPPLNFNNLAWDAEPPSYIPELNYDRLVKEFENSGEGLPGSEQSKLIAAVQTSALGVFYLKNPPIKENTIQALVNTTRAFLSLSPAEQAPYYVAEGEVVGLTPFGCESTEAAVNRGLGITSTKPIGTDQCIKFSYELNNPGNKWANEQLKVLSEAFLLGVRAQSLEVLKWIVQLYPPEDELLDSLFQTIEGSVPTTRHLLYTNVSADNASECKMHQHADISLVTTSYRMPASNGFKALHYKVNEEFRPTPAPRNTSSMHMGEAFAAYYQGEKKMNSPVHYVAMPPEDKRDLNGEHTTLVTFLNAGKNAKVPPFKNSYYRTYHQEVGGNYSAAADLTTSTLARKVTNKY